MDKKFRKVVDGLEKKCEALLAMEPVIAREMPKNTPVGGIYLFSEGKKNLYVGRTKRKIFERIKGHFSAAPDCPFAWRLAREATGKKATYKREGSQKELLKDPVFKAEYKRAKERIRKMKVRYVRESDPVKQAILEIYVAVATGAKHNDFDTH